MQSYSEPQYIKFIKSECLWSKFWEQAQNTASSTLPNYSEVLSIKILVFWQFLKAQYNLTIRFSNHTPKYLPK